MARTSRNPLAVVIGQRPQSHHERLRFRAGIGIVGAERGLAGFLEKPQQQHDSHGGGRESNDDAGDHQCLRHRIAAEPGCRASARNDAEEEEHAGSEKIERQNLAQRLRDW